MALKLQPASHRTPDGHSQTPAARAATAALAESLSTIIREAVFDAFAELMDGERAQPPAPNGLVDRAAIAERLSVCTATIANLERKGLPRVMVGDSVRYDPDDVLAWLKARSAQAGR